MKKIFLLLLVFLVSNTYAQSVNDYSAVIVPTKYEFLKLENQYRLNTLTKFALDKAGFVAFYTNETIPAQYNDRCSLLRADVIKESGFLVTKLYVVLKDCNEKVIFKSAVGRSKAKDFGVAYSEALNDAFQSIYDLEYKYGGGSPVVEVKEKPQMQSNPIVATSFPATTSDTKAADLLYAQATPTGYQLIDATPKVVMKLMKTSQPNSYIAIKGTLQGSLILKENQWFFEYYNNDQLISEKVNVKF